MASRRRAGKRTFGEISKLPSGRFRARFTGPDLNRHSAPTTFVARMDAEAWLAAQERLISRGEWQAPTSAPSAPAPRPPTLADYAATVIGRRRLRPATVALYEKLLRPPAASGDRGAVREAAAAGHRARVRRPGAVRDLGGGRHRLVPLNAHDAQPTGTPNWLPACRNWPPETTGRQQHRPWRVGGVGRPIAKNSSRTAFPGLDE